MESASQLHTNYEQAERCEDVSQTFIVGLHTAESIPICHNSKMAFKICEGRERVLCFARGVLLTARSTSFEPSKIWSFLVPGQDNYLLNRMVLLYASESSSERNIVKHQLV